MCARSMLLVVALLTALTLSLPEVTAADAAAHGPLPWVHEHYDAVSIHATESGGQYLAFWRDGKARALRWRLDDMQWQANGGCFRLEWREANCWRVIDFDVLIAAPDEFVSCNNGPWWAMWRVMTDLRAPD